MVGTIPEQLTDIYYKHEHWHAFKMPYHQALKYHEKRVKNGDIQVYIENGGILGYYQRHFVYNVCFLDNVWIKKEYRKGKVFKELYKKFFATLPAHITFIFGEHEETVFRKIRISQWRRNHGYNKN